MSSFRIHRRLAATLGLGWVALLAFLFVGCQSDGYRQKRSTFLRTANAGWARWLDEKVTVRLDHLPLWQLRQVEGLQDGNYYLDGQTAGGVLISLDLENVSRRDVFWEIHRTTGLLVDFSTTQGVTVIRFRSRLIVDLKGE